MARGVPFVLEDEFLQKLRRVVMEELLKRAMLALTLHKNVLSERSGRTCGVAGGKNQVKCVLRERSGRSCAVMGGTKPCKIHALGKVWA